MGFSVGSNAERGSIGNAARAYDSYFYKEYLRAYLTMRQDSLPRRKPTGSQADIVADLSAIIRLLLRTSLLLNPLHASSVYLVHPPP